MKETELRFAADTVALLNVHRIQLRNDQVALISGHILGESGTFGELLCRPWTNYMWECGTPMGTNSGDIVPEPFVETFSTAVDTYIATLERVLNSKGEYSILHYATMDMSYKVEFELREPGTGLAFGVVGYDADAKRYVFTAASDMPRYRY